MDERIVKFIATLRGAGVRISLAESTDAFRAVGELGASDREAFRLGLRTTLIKDARDLQTFDELFSLFFVSTDAPPTMDLAQEMSAAEAQMLAEALQSFTDRLQRKLERLLRGEGLTQGELEQLARIAGLERSTSLRQQEWMARRMAQALRFREVQEALRALEALLDRLGLSKARLAQLREVVKANQQAMIAQLHRYAGRQIAEKLAERRMSDERQAVEALLEQPFNALSAQELALLRKQVQRLASRLRSRVALRQKRARDGRLDAKSTIRANLRHGSVPLLLRHRDRILKPKLVIICDISTSMRPCSELMLSLVHALHDQVSKTHAFAFIDHLEYISPDLDGKQAGEAVGDVLLRMPSGHYNTDLGYSLVQFERNYLATIDGRTTFIVVGDGRNNHNNPHLELFGALTRRARRSIWLNPEPPVLWGTGDSDMLKYARLCNTVLQVSTMAELTTAVDRLLVGR